MDTAGTENNRVQLKRVIGLFDGINLIFGTIIGSGIFITPAGVLAEVHSVYTALIIWLICGLVSILGAFCFAELAQLVPKSGSGYAYLYEAFSPLNRFGDIPAFLSCWMSALAITPATFAVLALTSAQYLALAIFGNCSISSVVIKCMAIVIIRNTSNLKFDMKYSEKNPLVYVTALYYGLFTYDGWIALNNLVEEMKNPKRNLPLAIAIGLITIICLYLMVNISYLTLLTPSEMIDSKAVALTWAEKALGVYAVIILLGVFVSVFGSSFGLLLSNTRIIYAGSRDSNFPIIFSMIDSKHLTPTPAIIFTAAIGLFMIAFSSIYQLLDFFNFLIWVFYGLDIIALFILRKRDNIENKNENGFKLKLPILFPIIMLIFCLLLMVLSISSPNYGHLSALAFLISGLIYYFPFVHYKKSYYITDKLTGIFQLILNVTTETVIKTNENKE